MKKDIFTVILCFITMITAVSCDKKLEQSEFNEFELTDQNGTVRRGAIYLPQGMSRRAKYPVIIMEDGLVFKEAGFKELVDSLIEVEAISPVIVACSFENKMTIPGYKLAYRNAEFIESLAITDSKLQELFDSHYNYFKETFIPYINSNYPVSADVNDRIYFGTSNSADFGITLGLREGDLFSEYWCYSPVYSDVSRYGALNHQVNYRICWGSKEEAEMADYFQTLTKDIRKRGGNVYSWVFNGGHDRKMWKHWFKEELMRRFPF